MDPGKLGQIMTIYNTLEALPLSRHRTPLNYLFQGPLEGLDDDDIFRAEMPAPKILVRRSFRVQWLDLMEIVLFVFARSMLELLQGAPQWWICQKTIEILEVSLKKDVFKLHDEPSHSLPILFQVVCSIFIMQLMSAHVLVWSRAHFALKFQRFFIVLDLCRQNTKDILRKFSVFRMKHALWNVSK